MKNKVKILNNDETLYNVTVSFKVSDELKYTIQYYISHHILNKLKIVNNSYYLNDGLSVGTMTWVNIDSKNVAQLQGCIKELAEMFLLKDIKFNEQLIETSQEPMVTTS
jgi:hypothetical protein